MLDMLLSPSLVMFPFFSTVSRTIHRAYKHPLTDMIQVYIENHVCCGMVIPVDLHVLGNQSEPSQFPQKVKSLMGNSDDRCLPDG